MNPLECNGRTLAFLGDAVWSLAVRDFLVQEGQGKGKMLQKLSISFVSAKSQARFYSLLHEENFFTEEEEATYHRGRNGNTDVVTYRMSTGFEAILGALYLENNQERIRQIWDKVRTL